MNNLTKRFPRYSKLLWLYPSDYRAEYSEQILQTLADMLDNTATSKRWLVWLRATRDFPVSVSRQQLSYSAEVMSRQTPGYVKRNAEISGLLLIPFFVIIIVNSLDHHALPSSRLALNALRFLIAGLPAIAFTVAGITFIKWAVDRRKRQKINFWHSLFDIRRNWPLLATAGLGTLIVAFVFGHDSAHCLAGNPIRELHNPYQTTQCLLHQP